MDANTNAALVQSKILGNDCIPTTMLTTNNPDATTTGQQQHHQNSIEINQDLMDNASDCELDVLSNDEHSSEPSNDALKSDHGYSTQRVKFASPKSSSENNVDDRRLRRQIANCNERRRMQSINAGFQALRQFLPQRSGEKLSKAAILQQTAELIQTLQLGRRSADQCKPTSDEEANEADRPQCKKRRITIKSEPKASIDVNQDSGNQQHMENRLNEYIKIIEDLREALTKEQQLRLLYEQKLTDLKTTLSQSLGFVSMPNGINLDRNENVQQQPNLHQRSSSADGLLAPKNVNDNNNSTSALLYNNLTALTEAALNYNNQMRMARQANHGALSALLSPNQLNGLHFGAQFGQQQQVQNVHPFVNLLAASLQASSTGQDSLPLTSQAPVSQQQSPTNPNQPNAVTPSQNTLYAIAEALRQIENENSKNFSSENLDVLVR